MEETPIPITWRMGEVGGGTEGYFAYPKNLANVLIMLALGLLGAREIDGHDSNL